MNYIDVKTAAKRWDLTERRVTTLCRTGRISGAYKENGLWLIPAHAGKPTDGRRNKLANLTHSNKLLPLPIGVSDFKKIVTGYYYVDKTLLIRDFLDTRAQVTLFMRPKKKKKTLNMDMIRTFFETTNEDTSIYFKHLDIWTCGEEYRREQGQYPVIFITFKDVKFSTYPAAVAKIQTLLCDEFDRHRELLESPKLSDYDKHLYRQVMSGDADEVSLQSSFATLSKLLHTHYGKPAIIIIDEYDTPIQQGYTAGYYDKIVGFMCNLFSGAFKDNSHLAYGFLTGILRVAKESLFSGLNNLKVISFLEERYSNYFGFTKDEIKKMTDYYGTSDKYEEICEWYDGYRFGAADIFNPWSVLNYFDENCTAKTYWQSTGDSSIIRQIVSEADDETAENLRTLMQGESVSTYVDTAVIYPEIRSNPTTIYSFLLATGYLKYAKKDNMYDGNFICDVAVPNKEIFYVYEKEILSSLSDVISQDTAVTIKKAIIKKDVPALQKSLQTLLLDTISSFDYAHENFYHGLMLGICAIMNNLYRVDSNKESGLGRYDIQLLPRDKTMPGIIIELKVIREKMADGRIKAALKQSADEALDQIDKKQYITEMRRNGVSQFMKIGVSFHKKQVEIAYELT